MPVKNQSAEPGWNFDNSYAALSDQFFARVAPTPVEAPSLVITNEALAQELGLTMSDIPEEALALMFAGNDIPAGADPLSQAYAGHQFGNFTMLGDGRAHLLGEHLTPDGTRVDIQLKGSGRTPFGRRGDGRAALGPMLREYIISEAMHALGIPSTRALAVVKTGEPVFRETALPGAVLTRVAASHLRVGTFEYFAARKDHEGLKQLADYAIDRHYPDLVTSANPYLDFLKAVMDRQIALVVNWLRVGFIHGVMNTDNMTISGETIDYGPCAFMDQYDPATVFSSIDVQGRYAFGNQSPIAQWNLARLAESLLPLIEDDLEKAVSLAEEVLNEFPVLFNRAWLDMMGRKLGLFDPRPDDQALIIELLEIMQADHMDFTNTFHALISPDAPTGDGFESERFKAWWASWTARLDQAGTDREAAFDFMRANNPAIIPRNHKVEEALRAAEDQADFGPLQQLLEVLQTPYTDQPGREDYRTVPTADQKVLQTFCGT